LSFARALDDYRITAERIEDHGDERARGCARVRLRQGSGATTEATIHAVFTFRDGKISRYQEFYDEAARAG